MKEFIEKLIGRLEERIKSNVGWEEEPYFKGENMAYEDAIEIVNQLAEEYKADKVNQLAMMYAQNMYMYGVDVTKAWETATSQSASLNEAYLRGLHDERKNQHIQMKNNGGWIPCSEGLPEESGKYLVTVENLTGYWIMENNVFVCDYQYNEFIFQGWEDNKIIAWQPLPAPYQPKGE